MGDQIGMALAEQVLVFDPTTPDVLKFSGDFKRLKESNGYLSTMLSIHNDTDATVAYNVKTMAPTRFLASPSFGKIDSGDTVKVDLILPRQLRPGMGNANSSRQKILVQSFKLD